MMLYKSGYVSVPGKRSIERKRSPPVERVAPEPPARGGQGHHEGGRGANGRVQPKRFRSPSVPKQANEVEFSIDLESDDAGFLQVGSF